MDLSAVQPFLASVKVNVGNAVTSTLGDIHVVFGNEAADLDSCISSIITAFYLAHSLLKEEKENKLDGQQSFVFPVINCAREDLPLRTEVIYVLRKNGVALESLICRDEIDLAGLQSTGRLKLTLVDHNVLAQGDAFLQNSIVRVIDHHKRERPLDRRDIIEPVGSCCTLVAEMVLGFFDKDPLVCSLLYGTILLDTINLSPSAQKATPKDFKIIGELEDSLTKSLGACPTRDEVYVPINNARTDISQLTPDQLLRKDCKVLKTPEITIAVPAVPLLSQKFLELPGALEALKNSLRLKRCTAIVLMGWEVDSDGIMRRDITIFSDGIHKAKQVCTPLENCNDLQLQLVRNSTESQSVYWTYKQQNAALSRKFILPFLVTHFEVKAQNHLEDALAGVEILIPNGEMSPNKISNGQVPSISYSSVQSLGVGDPISHGGSNQSSAYNSCPYTPQNSTADPEDGYPSEQYFLPSFNSREMIEKIELKRHKLRGYDKTEDQLNPSSYPFTPKNSYVESSMEALYEQRQNTAGVLNEIDSDVLLRKLMEKRKDNFNSNPNTHSNSNASSKSQSLTKLNIAEELIPLSSGDASTQLSPSFPHQIPEAHGEGGELK